jgi:hypothetical protein
VKVTMSGTRFPTKVAGSPASASGATPSRPPSKQETLALALNNPDVVEAKKAFLAAQARMGGGASGLAKTSFDTLGEATALVVAGKTLRNLSMYAGGAAMSETGVAISMREIGLALQAEGLKINLKDY